jgi:OOP family OmpA-OmpF porin
LQFPKTVEEVRAALKLDQSDSQLKSKTRSLADLQNTRAGALVEFATDSTYVIPTVELDNFGKALSDLEPGYTVQISGHTDNTGDANYNQNLSIRRAEAVRYHLIKEYGVRPDVIISRGYGESVPIADNVTPQGKQLNRRVEFNR